MEKATLGNTELREKIARWIKSNYCYCLKYNCPACLGHEVLGTIEVDLGAE